MNYQEMSADELRALRVQLQKEYDGFKAMDLSLDMTRGKPCSEQLDLTNGIFEGIEKTGFKTSSGQDVRNYGIPKGIDDARKLFAEILDTSYENIFIGNTSSLNMMFDAITRAVIWGEHDSEKPWGQIPNKKWLCPAPGYDRHFRVTEKMGFELIPVPMTSEGPDMDVVEELVKDPSVLGIWCVPVYSNPDGIVYSENVCKRLASMKTAAKDFRIFWDNAYVVHHLYDDESKQGRVPDILGLCEKAGNPSRVYEFASTSKVTFAGGGISALATNIENFDHADKIMFVQAICANKVNQLAHVNFLPDMEAVKKQMSKHAEILRPKFELALDLMDKAFDGTGIVRYQRPLGGYFISLFVFPGTAAKVVSLCKEAGVALTPAGATYPYGKDPDDSNIRIAPSFPSLDDISKAIPVLCVCAKMTAIDKILEAK